MKSLWAARISKNCETALGRLRLIPGIEVLESESSWWLRGSTLTDELQLKLRTLPDGELFRVLEDGQLIPIDLRVPHGVLPDGDWRPIREVISPSLPVTLFAGKVAEQAQLKLLSSYDEQAANVLLVPFQALYQWGQTAPLIRLTPLRFATRLDGTTIVCGTPLPSIRGQFFVERDGIAIVAGRACSPALSTTMLAGRWGLEAGDLCLWDDEGQQLIPSGQFIACGRSALQSTCDALRRGVDVSE
ncbi:hypothetical protein [Thalassoglobus polymorphus]|uniref:MoxR-vWA-beta-propeller ternary system domain-containing protein n=1 Tax=Thalassoglobus polymorphus TaxID=2527994 RepID=A0A517QKJ1_9PLAN|nr:hypothetical protein [Thalassoglobus polymorphus]QDT32156.1 hypothetical protein Mal48_13980 [Thalassoglobus polymorphus]